MQAHLGCRDMSRIAALDRQFEATPADTTLDGGSASHFRSWIAAPTGFKCKRSVVRPRTPMNFGMVRQIFSRDGAHTRDWSIRFTTTERESRDLARDCFSPPACGFGDSFDFGVFANNVRDAKTGVCELDIHRCCGNDRSRAVGFR